MLTRLAGRLVRPKPPPLLVGVAVCALFLVLETLLVYPLSHLAPREGLAVIFLVGVVVVSTVWGLRLAVVMSFISAYTFNVVHTAPTGRFLVRDTRDWVEVAVFLVVAVLASSMAQLARSRAAEALERHRESELIAGLARLMFGTDELSSVLPEASRRVACALELPFAELHLGGEPAGENRLTFPLPHHAGVGTLVVPADLPEPMVRRLRDRVVPALTTLLGHAIERAAIADSLRTSRDELRAIATEQESLRRVALLVARGVPPSDVVAAVAAETARLLDADATRLMRAEAPGTVTVIGEYSKPGIEPLLGKRLAIPGGATELVLSTGRPARVDSYTDRPGPLADLARREGFRASVGAPIVVEGRMWGALVVLWSRHGPPPDAENRLAQFTDLIATAVANTESRAELKASRARIVFAADEARRSFERDLHDGLQQRLVSLGLELRAAETMVPAEHDELRARLSHTTKGLADAFQDLQEITRGIHPAILSQGGLGPALKALARRCPVPVTLCPGPKRRLPGCVEVAAYYVVSEALNNAAKHAKANEIWVEVEIVFEPASARECLKVAVRDDGVGGADPRRGTGLLSLIDRVEALEGSLRITSPVHGGTTLVATLPTDADCARTPPC